ncbi:aminodeoxychorismate/anthranilate synthase component II [Rufibacter glacialis]|uniref:Aminodeoxychorismate/anthranilate synthase component II n=1 Tax=Rufibacter glacialis TaxID=1259555 RepID=A0A5M8QED4_9BACT|nr:aminodeoxychorismate/anthranilate synthase component II [Rufibacter glacialis]KAA6433324.1 aminodeoxychorismate/anthranilate synthase component II [Rufibacter glacialis]GGK75453.1 glutamine amidotransferase [Rufibacter glacialis]
MLLLLDNFDSFTYNLYDYFRQLGVAVEVRRNDVPLAELQALPLEGIVLSPGPGTPEKAGVMPAVIDFYHDRLPMLGICLGHQALGQFFGAKVEKGLRPMHGKVSQIHCAPDPIFAGLPEKVPVVRYHSLVVQEAPATLVPLAHTTEGELMAFRHAHLPLYALQFHPEAALTQHGLEMLRNWVNIANITTLY